MCYLELIDIIEKLLIFNIYSHEYEFGIKTCIYLLQLCSKVYSDSFVSQGKFIHLGSHVLLNPLHKIHLTYQQIPQFLSKIQVRPFL